MFYLAQNSKYMWRESAKDKVFKLKKYSALHAFVQNTANKRIYAVN